MHRLTGRADRRPENFAREAKLAEGRQMDGLGSPDRFIFEGFRFDLAAGGLFRTNCSGVTEPVALGSRALALLALFVERPGQLVSKDDIFAAAWSGTVVGENNLTVQISALRRVLDRDRAQGSCIQTIPGRGYRFIPAVTRAEADNVFGDGANMASQLEGSAAIDGKVVANPDTPSIPVPPSVNMSGDVDEVHRPEPEAVKSPGINRVPLLRRRHRAGIIAASAVGLLLIATIGWRSSLPWRIDAAGSVPRLSIVVLPFANLSNDPEQRYFTEGITEDLTTDLSRIQDMFVISHNTASTYEDKPLSAKQIGRELGVRYVLEGSVQRSGKQVRVNAQLIATQTDAHLWAERFERDIGDLFAVQNEITGRIAVALGSELVVVEAARPAEHPEALDYIFQGRAALNKPPAPDNYAEATSLFERALAVDPRSVDAQSWLAIALVRRVIDQMSDSPAANIVRAEGLVEQALTASPSSAIAHFAKGDLLVSRRRYAEAIAEYETVLASNRNSVDALAIIGREKINVGSIDEAIPLVEQAIRLSPRDPRWTGIWYLWIGQAHLLRSRNDEALFWLEKARSANPALPRIHLYLAAAYALNDEGQRAASELAEARRLVGDDRFSSIARVRATEYFPVEPKVRALFEATYFAGLRKAGMPKE